MRVFVYQAFVQAGGTYMAYHIGRILRQEFGLEVVAVGSPPSAGMFRYAVPLPVVDEDELIRRAQPDDLLICNPSFSDRMFGLRLPCRKLCYVQGLRTFHVLDVFFDRYVFVSSWVREFVNRYYGIDGVVIPAFIEAEVFHATGAAAAPCRKPVCVVMQRKLEPVVLESLCRVYSRMFGGPPPVELIPGVAQADLADTFRGSRVFLGLDTMEGFGLPMLEAMACGCAAVGWDSGGCGEYAHWGRDALLARYGDFQSLARLLHAALTDDGLAASLGAAGASSAAAFGRDRFERSWAAELGTLVRGA